MFICQNTINLIYYWLFSNKGDQIDFELQPDDIDIDDDFYCGCNLCHLTEQCGFFMYRPLKIIKKE